LSASAPAKTPAHLLPVLVLAQLAGVSPWFAVNAVMPALQRDYGWNAADVGTLTSAVQLGFIAGTLLFALLAVADRFSPRRVFLLCSLAGAACTLAGAYSAGSFQQLLLWRTATGFFLAGIYPVGMKIASQWFPQGLGGALGWLIGALVLGSASAHAVRAVGAALPWTMVFHTVAAAAALGGLLLYAALPERPRPAGQGAGLRWQALGSIWTDRKVRASVFGYFGHMWELYTMWVLVPAILATRLAGAALSWAAFAVLGVGALGCILGGQWARRIGSARVAAWQLAASGLCCVLAPWLLQAGDLIFAAWLLLWGITVAGDSPQFSALTAQNAPPQAVGSVLTLVNSIGFGISILSIQLFVTLAEHHDLAVLLPWLGLGPLLGVWALRPLWRAQR
jgi:MFS family permease